MEMDKKMEISDNENYHNHNDNNDTGNGNSLQGLVNPINPSKQSILPPPPLHIRNTNTNNNGKTNIPKSYQRTNKNIAKILIQFKRKLIFLNKTKQSTNISTEEIKGTTDMQLLTSDEGSLLDQGEDNEPTESLLVDPETGPSRILPDTGFNILSSTDETVDLATEEDNTQKLKPIKTQKKTPKLKNAATSRSDTLMTNPRPKRACAIRTLENNKLRKLGKQGGSLTLPMKSIPSPMSQCPICNVFLESPELRKKHEVLEHESLLEFIQSIPEEDIVSTPENTPCIEQIDLFNYLGLCITSKHKKTIIQELASNTNLLKAFNSKGYETIGGEIKGPKIIGSFKCNYCPYETNLVFAKWAHETTKHLYQKCDSEKKTVQYCFLCKRVLNRRIQPLRHLDACINKLSELTITNNPPPSPPPKRLICILCNESFDSLIEHEKHIWGHAKK